MSTATKRKPRAAAGPQPEQIEQPEQTTQDAAGHAATGEPHGGLDTARIAEALAAPFDGSEVKFKPQAVSGNRALALPYVDARVIQDRLDEVLGVMGWQDSYECLPDGAVVCRLRIRLGTEWITKEDVGGQSEQPDEGDRRKAAFSDALKRAAVKFGIGRYLYRQKPQWCDYDPQKRQFVTPPRLPGQATPRKAAPVPAQEPTGPAVPPATNGHGKGKPATGAELKARLEAKDAALAAEGRCEAGELLDAVITAGVQAGHSSALSRWTGPAIDLAIEAVREFEAAHPAGRTAGRPSPAAYVAAADAQFAGEEISKPGELMKWIVGRFRKGLPGPIEQWPASALPGVQDAVREFEHNHRTAAT